MIFIIVVFIVIILIGITQIKMEKFTTNIYLHNQMRDALDSSSTFLDTINISKPMDPKAIQNSVINKYNSSSQEESDNYDIREAIQNDKLAKIESDIKNLGDQTVFVAPHTQKKLKSIKSSQNSRPLNIKGLENGNYMVHVNGKCLESNGLARTKIKPCNEMDPNQYFNVEMIYTQNDYENNINRIGKAYTIDTSTYKYPFNIIKSVTNGNCLTNNGSIISVRPCEPNISQQWKGSYDPITCTYEQV